MRGIDAVFTAGSALDLDYGDDVLGIRALVSDEASVRERRLATRKELEAAARRCGTEHMVHEEAMSPTRSAIRSREIRKHQKMK